MSNHERYKKQLMKGRLLGLGDNLDIRLLDGDRVKLVEVLDKEDDGILNIPSYITDIEYKASIFKSIGGAVGSCKVLSGCKYRVINIEVVDGRLLDISGLCIGLNDNVEVEVNIRGEGRVILDDMFKGCSNLRDISLNIESGIKVESMRGIFSNTDIRKMDFRGIQKESLRDLKDISNMFSFCRIQEVDLNVFSEADKIELAYGLFVNCFKLRELDLSGLNLSNVIKVHCICKNCDNLKVVKFGKYILNNIEDMTQMFYGCDSLEYVDMSGLNIVSNKDIKKSDIYGLCNNVVVRVNDTHKYLMDYRYGGINIKWEDRLDGIK